MGSSETSSYPDDDSAKAPWLYEDELALVRELLAGGVRFLIVGGRAVQHYGHPRPAKDLDLLVDLSADNWARAALVMPRLNASLPPFETLSQTRYHAHFQFYPTVELITSIRGVSFDEAWSYSTERIFKETPVRVLSQAHLILSKQGSDRAVDKEDIIALSG